MLIKYEKEVSILIKYEKVSEHVVKVWKGKWACW